MARGSARRVWLAPAVLCGESLPCPGSRPLGRVTHLGKGRGGRGLCTGLPPEKTPQLTALLQEGELGQADF